MTLRVRTCIAAVAVGLAFAAVAAAAPPPATSGMATCDGRGAGGDLAIEVRACTEVIATAGELPAEVAAAYFGRANIYLGLRDYDRAIQDYSQALKILPGDPLLLNNRCWARAVQGRDLSGALADCDEVTRLQPDSPVARDSRGFALLRLGRFDEAIDDYDASLRLNTRPDALQASSLYGRGVAEEKKGDATDGDTDIGFAESISPRIALMFASYGVRP